MLIGSTCAKSQNLPKHEILICVHFELREPVHVFFFSREPQKSGREHFHKSGREYFACAREYKNEKVPVNRKIAREQRKKCP